MNYTTFSKQAFENCEDQTASLRGVLTSPPETDGSPDQ